MVQICAEVYNICTSLGIEITSGHLENWCEDNEDMARALNNLARHASSSRTAVDLAQTKLVNLERSMRLNQHRIGPLKRHVARLNATLEKVVTEETEADATARKERFAVRKLRDQTTALEKKYSSLSKRTNQLDLETLGESTPGSNAWLSTRLEALTGQYMPLWHGKKKDRNVFGTVEAILIKAAEIHESLVPIETLNEMHETVLGYQSELMYTNALLRIVLDES